MHIHITCVFSSLPTLPHVARKTHIHTKGMPSYQKRTSSIRRKKAQTEARLPMHRMNREIDEVKEAVNLRLNINIMGTVTTNPCIDGDLVSDSSSQKVVNRNSEFSGCSNPLATVSQTCKGDV
jgi:hypothetical protein